MVFPLNQHSMICNWKKLWTAISHRLNFHVSVSLFSRIYIKILNQEYKVFYVGTNNGRIYKIVQFIQNGESKSTLLDIFEVAQNEAIQVMQISQKRKSLYVSTDHRVKQIDLAMCSRRYDSCFRCVKDPYCGWDESTNSCKPYELGLLQVSFMATCKMGKRKKYTTTLHRHQHFSFSHRISSLTHRPQHSNSRGYAGTNTREKILIRKFFLLTFQSLVNFMC